MMVFGFGMEDFCGGICRLCSFQEKLKPKTQREVLEKKSSREFFAGKTYRLEWSGNKKSPAKS